MKILNSWQIYALASAFFAGLVAIFAKIGVTHISSNMATLIRTIVITLFLIVLISLRAEWANPMMLSKKDLIFLILSGVATGLSWICYFKALQIGPISGVVSLDKLSLLFAVIMAILFLGEHPSLKEWSGIILMACGALLIA